MTKEAVCGTLDGVKYVKISGVSQLDVNKTFDCGQCFRFEPVKESSHDVEFCGVAFGRFVSFAQDGDTLYVYNTDERDFREIWSRFLALDVDYGAIAEDIAARSDNEGLQRAIEYGEGIRILRQDPWEAVCSFIISQNNNIPRIKKIVEALAARCGERIEIPEALAKRLGYEGVAYAFPSAESLVSLGVDGLFEMKTGFRAKYIYDAAVREVNGEIDHEYLRVCDSTADAVKSLCAIKGVGPKVASCALLFGYERYDAFPVDVWIKKVIEKYFLVSPKDFTPDILGKYAGIAQQYLFYYERYINEGK